MSETDKKTVGRPRKIDGISTEQFEKLCQFQCTQNDIAYFFNVSHDTIQRFCIEKYGAKFQDVFDRFKQSGLCSLRMWQFQAAKKGNPTLLIWLGKQYLGQADSVQSTITFEDDPITNSIKEKLNQWDSAESKS